MTRCFANRVPLALVTLVAITHWLVAPYRDQPWFKLSRGLDDVPAYRFLHIASPHIELIEAYRRAVGGELTGREALIASERPALYMALQVHPQTCMLYMHSAGDANAAAVLMGCLRQRQPDVVLDVDEWLSGDSPSTLRKLIADYVRERGMVCRRGSINEHWIHAAPNQRPLAYRLCAAPSTRTG